MCFIVAFETLKAGAHSFDMQAESWCGPAHSFAKDANEWGTRHTFSVELLKAGVNIRKVSRALGHLRDRHRAVLCEVEQGTARHFR